MQQLIEAITKAGYRVFMSKSGTYGFFTDVNGSKVICIDTLYGVFRFTGNYRTDLPNQTGSGWLITDNYPDTSIQIDKIFNAMPPQWATQGSNWRFTTLVENLKTYKSSGYVEVI